MLNGLSECIDQLRDAAVLQAEQMDRIFDILHDQLTMIQTIEDERKAEGAEDDEEVVSDVYEAELITAAAEIFYSCFKAGGITSKNLLKIVKVGLSFTTMDWMRV